MTGELVDHMGGRRAGGNPAAILEQTNGKDYLYLYKETNVMGLGWQAGLTQTKPCR